MVELGWLTWLAAACACLWSLTLAYLVWGIGRVDWLRDLAPAADGECPPVTVCVAARDEAADVEVAVRSFLSLDYPDLEVVAVDDRSSDGTGRILRELAAGNEPMTALRIEELPDGWLGKNHAIHRAASRAGGDLLLFTDADVVLEPGALRRAVGRMERRGLDHLTAAAEQAWPTSLLRATGALLQAVLLQRIRPWRVGGDDAGTHAGVGVFNLVRRDAYREAGGHRAIARQPVDDMALAERLHEIGARSEFLWGQGMIRVRWYGSVEGFVRGIGRSAMADFGYSAATLTAVAGLTVILHTGPWVGVVLLEGPGRWLSAVPVLSAVALYHAIPDATGARPWDALWWPAAGSIMAWTLLRAALLFRWRGGMTWRGTFYPLEQLRDSPP